MEEEKQKKEGRDKYEPQEQHQPPYISQMQPVTHEAYGGGLYGKDDEKEVTDREKEPLQHKPPASETQSADGPDEVKTLTPKHKQPASSGDRDVDITGQSYIQ
ncbi:hypothetical protein CARUB_v10027946mg [Capsella rubella]|uniref:Uncharacterized protein n=1 Tax=Capsella rubella TaxID=81985 RepID=R0F097_9BRAS|nr:uncharacterized protein LOC17875706 [Capsella rubella]EOA14676.1 hypothetical protein CARUB_v10027946mg [Capsella rubella]